MCILDVVIYSFLLTMCILDVVSRRKTVQMGNQWMEKGSGQTRIFYFWYSADMQIRQRRELRLIRSAELLNGRVEEFKRRRRERSTTTDNYCMYACHSMRGHYCIRMLPCEMKIILISYLSFQFQEICHCSTKDKCIVPD
ncbi:hypothetical protein M514_28196 [Trichuris suis]|uniref:Secreted protein n=1 Tax=Trichuris suis TaxID=68888 RepID=A0A085MQX9_9BILA|nr:hypothetical protein M514_28196 [Trichuris suis]